MNPSIQQLQHSIDHQFTNVELLTTALTHRSFSGSHNERLEFLGDSLVNMIVAELLFETFGTVSEGKLSQQRAMLVKGDTLAEVALELDLGQFLRLGAGEIKTGGRERASILADAVEAIIAAIYLDSDFEQCRRCVRRWYKGRIDNFAALGQVKDAKTRLQEFMQAKAKPLPVYETEEVLGAQHDQQFIMSCKVALLAKPTIGKARSRKMAEQIAAELALQALGENNE